MFNKFSSNELLLVIALPILFLLLFFAGGGLARVLIPPSPTPDETATVVAQAVTTAAQQTATFETEEALTATADAEPTPTSTETPTAAATTPTTTAETDTPTATKTLTVTATTLTPSISPTSTASLTSTPTITPPTSTPTNTLESPTFTPTSTPTMTPIPLFEAIMIDNRETQLDRSKLPANNFRLLRWRPWPDADKMPEGWYYVVSLLPADDPNRVFTTTVVSIDEAIQGTGVNEGWLTYSFNIIDQLPDKQESCYPYWDVIVGIDEEFVNCPQERIREGICRLTKFSEIQRALATERPNACASFGGDSNSGSRGGSSNSSGTSGTGPIR